MRPSCRRERPTIPGGKKARPAVCISHEKLEGCPPPTLMRTPESTSVSPSAACCPSRRVLRRRTVRLLSPRERALLCADTGLSMDQLRSCSGRQFVLVCLIKIPPVGDPENTAQVLGRQMVAPGSSQGSVYGLARVGRPMTWTSRRSLRVGVVVRQGARGGHRGPPRPAL